MSYQLIELKIENYARLVTDTKPLYVPLGAVSPNDMTTLKVSVVVGSVSSPCSAALTIEESMDGGATWKTIITDTDGPITATGTFSVWVTNDTGIPSPQLRLKVLPNAGHSLYLTKAFRTFSTGDVIVPRSSIVASGVATEATLQKLRRWPYADWDSITVVWTPGTFTEVWSYRTGGIAGTVVATDTIVYSDVSKSSFVSSVKSPEVTP